MPWRKSRCIFYWRLKRLLYEDQVKKEIMKSQQNLNESQVRAMVRRWFVEDKGTTYVRFLLKFVVGALLIKRLF